MSRWCVVMGVVLLTACGGPHDVRLVGPSGYFRDDQTLDFGALELGQLARKELGFFNGGSDAAELISVRRLSGDAVSAPPFLDEEGALFLFDDFGPAALSPLEQRTKSVRYDPPAAATELDHHAVVEFDFRTPRGVVTLTVTLSGHALHFTCGQPTTLDFFGVYRGEASTLEYVFTNPRDVPDDITVTAPSNTDFTFSEVGTLTLAPHAEHTLRVSFAPDAVGSFSDMASMKRSLECAPLLLRLLANSTERVLSTSSFDATVRIGTQGTLTALVKSVARLAVPVTATVVGDGFSLARADLVVPPATRGRDDVLLPGVLTAPLTFAATQAGTFHGELRVSTGLPRQPTLVVPLTVVVF